MRGSFRDQMMNGLALLMVIATTALTVVYLVIGVRPTVPLNPFPPLTSSLPPTSTPTDTPTPSPTPRILPSPTPIRPATLTPTPEPAMPFTATVKTGVVGPETDCRRALISGTVTDRGGNGLEGYPLHLWGPGLDMVLRTDGQGRWKAILPASARGIWHLQLHAPDPSRLYPPLSPVIAIPLPDDCPQAWVSFRGSE